MKIEDIHKHLGKRVILNIPPTALRETQHVYTIDGRAHCVPPSGVDLTLFGGLDLDGNVQVIDYFSNAYSVHHKFVELPQEKYILGAYHPTRHECNRWAIRDRVTGTTIGTYSDEEHANKVLAILNGTT